MINLKILVPDDTRNYITNPAFRYATTGWSTNGATLTRSLDYARFGIASGKVVTNGSVLNEGAYFRVSTLIGISEPVTASIYVRGSGKIRLRLINNPFGTQWITDLDERSLSPDRWKRLEVTGFSTGSNDMRLYVESADTTPKAITFYVDGAQMERKPYSTTYCDGDQPGCRWNVANHGSISSRQGDTRQGGRWISLAGPCRPNNDLYVTTIGGLGLPPITNSIQTWSNQPGGFYQSTKVKERVVTFSFYAKSERTSSRVSLKPLHELRQQLIDILKPDKTIGGEPFLFQYEDTEGDKPLRLWLRYEAGLEGSWDTRNQWFSSFPVRMIAVDPFFEQDTQDVMQLGFKNTVPYVAPYNSYAWSKMNGIWDQVKNASGVALGYGSASGTVRCSVIAPDGSVYFGGSFTAPSGANAICKWNGSDITTLGSGCNSTVYGIAIGMDGTVYACGSFTNAGGVAAAKVAKYNPTTGLWSAMGTGLTGGSAIGYGICVGPNGQVYVVGDFTAAGGVTCRNIARWDGVQWRTVGAMSGVDAAIQCITNGTDGRTLYIGGSFQSEYGGSVIYNRVARVDSNTNLISRMGSGLSGSTSVLAIDVGIDGTVYAGGLLETYENIAAWSGGKTWYTLGAGSPVTIYSIATGPNGEIYTAGGSYTGNKADTVIMKWYGGNWNPAEFPSMGYVSISSGNVVYTISISKNGDIFIGGTIYLPAWYPKINTVVNNGSCSCWPKMYISGQGTLRYIANTKTGQEIFLNLIVYSGEEIEIDFARGKIVSSVRGDMIYAIMPGSEIRSIYLLPGENLVEVLVTDEVSPVVQIRWSLLDWSADAIVNAEEL